MLYSVPRTQCGSFFERGDSFGSYGHDVSDCGGRRELGSQNQARGKLPHTRTLSRIASPSWRYLHTVFSSRSFSFNRLFSCHWSHPNTSNMWNIVPLYGFQENTCVKLQARLPTAVAVIDILGPIRKNHRANDFEVNPSSCSVPVSTSLSYSTLYSFRSPSSFILLVQCVHGYQSSGSPIETYGIVK